MRVTKLIREYVGAEVGKVFNDRIKNATKAYDEERETIQELKCPHCGSLNVDYSDCYDTEITFDHKKENDIVIRKMNGYCDDCGATDLLWEEIYEFVGIRNIMTNN